MGSPNSKFKPSRSNEKKSARRSPQNRRANMDPELYARLQSEAKAPYRGLRHFIYIACAASGVIGGFVFLAQIASGDMGTTALSNLAIQAGVIGLMVFLLRIDRAKK
ncbi:MAG: DUF3493 domain-containing protein [Elainellaceae cyanobacterium]